MRAIASAQLFQNIVDVLLNRAFAHVEAISNGFVWESVADEGGDFLLTAGE
jgi:hypothetical protein